MIILNNCGRDLDENWYCFFENVRGYCVARDKKPNLFRKKSFLYSFNKIFVIFDYQYGNLFKFERLVSTKKKHGKHQA